MIEIKDLRKEHKKLEAITRKTTKKIIINSRKYLGTDEIKSFNFMV